MLKFFRKKKQSKLIMVVLGAIIVVFVFWGMWTGRGGRDTGIVAWVDGYKIKTKDYEKAYRRQLEYYRKMFKGQLSDKLLERLNLRQRTLDGLVNKFLMLEDAKANGINVSEGELRETIQNIPVFQKDGVFDRERYFAVLKSNRIMVGDFEKDLKDQLVIEKAQQRVLKNISVSDKEVIDSYRDQYRRLNFYYVEINSSRFLKDIEVSDDDARKYLEKNKNAFMLPAKINALYAFVAFKDLMPAVKISKEDIKHYYEKNISSFAYPQEVRARHILIKPISSESNKENRWAAAKKKAEDILKRIKKGEDFASLAKRFSDDKASAKKGGDIGYFKRGSMIKPFEDAAFSLKRGEISGLVKTSFGYHIIKVVDIKEAGTLSINKASKKIVDILKLDNAKKIARDKLKSMSEEIKGGKTVDELSLIASKKGIKLVETGYFSANELKNDINKNPILRKKAFMMDSGTLSDSIETPSGLYLIKIIDRKEKHIPAYEEVAERVKRTLQKKMAVEKAMEKAADILKTLKEGKDLNTIVEEKGFTVKETGFITKANGFIPGPGIYIGNNEEIFSLSKKSPYLSKPLNYGDGVFIFKLKGKKDADMKGFEDKKKKIKEKLLQEKREKAFTKWLNDLRAKSKIVINKEKL